jgi:hypothetical protein
VWSLNLKFGEDTGLHHIFMNFGKDRNLACMTGGCSPVYDSFFVFEYLVLTCMTPNSMYIRTFKSEYICFSLHCFAVCTLCDQSWSTLIWLLMIHIWSYHFFTLKGFYVLFSLQIRLIKGVILYLFTDKPLLHLPSPISLP